MSEKKPQAGIEVGPTREDGTVGIKPGQSMVRNEGVKKIQAVALIREMAVNGGNLTAAAKKFNLSTATVRSRLSYAQRAGLFVQHEDTLLTGIVPRAEQALLGFLEPTVIDGMVLPYSKEQATVAVQVFKGVGLFRKPGTTAPATAEVSGSKGLTLEDHINALREKAAQLNPDPEPPEEAVDVEYEYSVLRESQAALGELAGGDLQGPEDARGPGSPKSPDERPPATIGASDGTPDQEARDGHPLHLSSVSGEAEAGVGPAGQGHPEAPPLPDAVPEGDLSVHQEEPLRVE